MHGVPVKQVHNIKANRTPTSPPHPQWLLQLSSHRFHRTPLEEGYNSLVMFTKHLGSDIWIVPTTTSLTAEQFALLFFQHWYCENGLPLEIILDCDKLFLSHFWRKSHKLTGIKLKISTAYHPELDRASEQTNKTVIQAIQFIMEWDQKDGSIPSQRFNLTSCT